MIEVPQQFLQQFEQLLKTASKDNATLVLFVALMVAGTFLVIAVTGYFRQRKENKQADGVVSALTTVTDVFKEQLEDARETHAKFEKRLAEAQQINAQHAETSNKTSAATQQLATLLNETTRLITEARRMAGIDKDQIIHEIGDVGKELVTGVEIAKQNQEIARDTNAEVKAQKQTLEGLSTAVDAVPNKTAAAVTNAILEPLREEFSKITAGIHELAVSISEQELRERKTIVERVEELARKMDELQLKFNTIEESTKPHPANETNIIELKPDGEQPPAA